MSCCKRPQFWWIRGQSDFFAGHGSGAALGAPAGTYQPNSIERTRNSAIDRWYSAADCAALIREAALTAMREALDAAQVTAAHLDKARETVRPSLDPAQLAALAAYASAR